jgi:hypothetical protein
VSEGEERTHAWGPKMSTCRHGLGSIRLTPCRQFSLLRNVDTALVALDLRRVDNYLFPECRHGVGSIRLAPSRQFSWFRIECMSAFAFSGGGSTSSNGRSCRLAPSPARAHRSLSCPDKLLASPISTRRNDMRSRETDLEGVPGVAHNGTGWPLFTRSSFRPLAVLEPDAQAIRRAIKGRGDVGSGS